MDIARNADGEGGSLVCSSYEEPIKLIFSIRLIDPDTETRKLGERTGLDTPVVPAVNDAG